jgi:tRNA acetyltransferase TAN1
MRNHNTLDRLDIIKEVAKCMPDNYTVDLDGPEVFVLVEVFKVCQYASFLELKTAQGVWQSVCGVSILRDYYKLQKFNVMTLANEKNMVDNFKRDAGRVQGKEADDVKLTEAILEST